MANGGVSIVICCHNSTSRLRQTLAHLMAQQAASGVDWEVIVVDNGSTDATADKAKEWWKQDIGVPLRIVSETRIGLSHARNRGLAEAQYDIVSFVDDDNWVSTDWVQTVSDIMMEHPEVGACGGANEIASEVDPIPWWFERFQGGFAVGEQGQGPGDVTDSRGFLWGAGLSMRKDAFQHLQTNGFRALLEDRKGSSLSSGGDSELCWALRLTGWRLWYDPRLRLKHFMPAGRLNWNYYRRICRGFGHASPRQDPYRYLLNENAGHLNQDHKRLWSWQVLRSLKHLATYRTKLVSALYRPMEGDPDIPYLEIELGRLFELMRIRGSYNSSFHTLSAAQWRQTPAIHAKHQVEMINLNNTILST